MEHIETTPKQESVLITPVATIYDGGRADVFEFSNNDNRFAIIISHSWSALEVVTLTTINDYQKAALDEKVSEICEKKDSQSTFKKFPFKPEIRFLKMSELHGDLDGILSAVAGGKMTERYYEMVSQLEDSEPGM